MTSHQQGRNKLSQIELVLKKNRKSFCTKELQKRGWSVLSFLVLVWYNKSEYCQSGLLLLLYSNRALCWPWHSDVGWKAILQTKPVERFPLSGGHAADPPWWKDATLANKVGFFFFFQTVLPSLTYALSFEKSSFFFFKAANLMQHIRLAFLSSRRF